MLSPQSTLDPAVPPALRRAIHDHWGLFAAEGAVLLILGVAAILIPLVAGLAATVFLGWLLAIAGGIGLASTLRARGAPGFNWSLLSAVAALLAGAIIIVHPLAGLITLTYVLVFYFFLDGVFVISLALSHRREASGRWEWLLLNGVIDLFLALLVIAGMPGTFAWALGLLVGIDLLFAGTSLIAMALAARQATLG